MAALSAFPDEGVGNPCHAERGGATSIGAAPRSAHCAVQHRAEKGKKTLAEMRADRRAGGLPDNVRPSRAKSRAGQYYVRVSAPVDPRRPGGKTKKMSVVKPGTDGYCASTTVAEEVLDEWIKKERPRKWLAKEKK